MHCRCVVYLRTLQVPQSGWTNLTAQVAGPIAQEDGDYRAGCKRGGTAVLLRQSASAVSPGHRDHSSSNKTGSVDQTASGLLTKHALTEDGRLRESDGPPRNARYMLDSLQRCALASTDRGQLSTRRGHLSLLCRGDSQANLRCQDGTRSRQAGQNDRLTLQRNLPRQRDITSKQHTISSRS
jgi:hypothetical protein